MIVDLADKLIDRLLDLARERQSEKAKLFDLFVQPTFDDLELVNSDYLRSFEKYRTYLTESQNSMNAITELVEALLVDSVSSAHLRLKILALDKLNVQKEVRPFVDAVLAYLIYPCYSVYHSYALPTNSPDGTRSSYETGTNLRIWHRMQDENVVRMCSMNNMSRAQLAESLLQNAQVRSNQAVEWAIKDLNQILIDLQQRYGVVCDEYARARQNLILI